MTEAPSKALWMGEVPPHWNVKALKFCAGLVTDRVDGANAGAATYVGLEHIEGKTGRLVRAEGSQDSAESTVNRFQSGDVLFGKLRPYLAKAAVADSDGVCSSEILVYRPHGLTAPYLKHVMLLSGFIEEVTSSTYGSKMPRADASFISRLPVPQPPIKEQLAIASYLDAETARIDGLIDEKRRLLETTRELRQATIAQLVTGSNLQSRKAASRIKWLAEIPADWQSAQLRHVCDVVTDGAHVSPDSSSPDYHFVSTVDIKDGRIDFENSLRTSASSFDVMRRTGCCPLVGDVLFSKDGTIGRTTVVDDERPFAVASSLVIIRPDSQIIDSRFLNHWLNHRTLKEELELLLAGAALRRISVEKVARLDIAFPDIRTQREIAAEIDDELVKADSLIAHVTREIELLQELRSATITDAVLGRIDVREHRKN